MGPGKIIALEPSILKRPGLAAEATILVARVTKLLRRNYRFDWIAPGEIQIYAEIRRKYKSCVACG